MAFYIILAVVRFFFFFFAQQANTPVFCGRRTVNTTFTLTYATNDSSVKCSGEQVWVLSYFLAIFFSCRPSSRFPIRGLRVKSSKQCRQDVSKISKSPICSFWFKFHFQQQMSSDDKSKVKNSKVFNTNTEFLCEFFGKFQTSGTKNNR